MGFHGLAEWEETLREYQRLWDRAVRVVPLRERDDPGEEERERGGS